MRYYLKVDLDHAKDSPLFGVKKIRSGSLRHTEGTLADVERIKMTKIMEGLVHILRLLP